MLTRLTLRLGKQHRWRLVGRRLISGSSHPGHWHLTPLEEKAFGDLWFCNTACKKTRRRGRAAICPSEALGGRREEHIFCPP